MAEAWCPFAIHHNGRFANYGAGQVLHVSAVVCHYTVGVNSIGTLGQDFTFLVDRDGDIHQGAPVDAVVWHAGEPWNHRGPGIEVEYHPVYDDAAGDGQDDEDVMTEAQVASLNALVHWLHDEWGVTLEYYDGPRIRDWQGFIAHRAVIQTGDWHNDYWPQGDASRIFATAPVLPPPPPLIESDNVKILTGQTHVNVFYVDDAGVVSTRYYPIAGGSWGRFVLSPHAALPNAALDVQENAPNEIDVYAPTAGGAVVHAWYAGGTWHDELLV